MPISQSKELRFTTTYPPHLRDRVSLSEIVWTKVLVLLAPLFLFHFFFAFEIFRVLTVASLAAVVTEMTMRKVLGGKTSLYDGSAVLAAFLFVLMLPPTLPSWVMALGVAFGLVLGREIFGGLGQNPFHPALVGVAFLWLTFPGIPHPSLVLEPLQAYAALFALLGGGIFLALRKIIYGEVPLLYAGIFFLIFLTLKPEEGIAATGEAFPIFLTAFFLITDPATTPLTRAGARGFAVGAGALSALLGLKLDLFQATVSSVLMMNALTPWWDHWLKPTPFFSRK